MTTRPAPDPAGFDRAVRAYDDAHPVTTAAVRSTAVQSAWLAAQLRKRRQYLLNLAAAFGLGDAALAAAGDKADEQLDRLESFVQMQVVPLMYVD